MADARVFECVVYKAGKRDNVLTGADGYADWASPEVIEKACANFLRDGARQIGIQHADGTVGAAEVWASYQWPAESPWIYKGRVVAEQGDWIIKAHVLDDQTWNDIKAGKFTGVSMQGTGKRRISE